MAAAVADYRPVEVAQQKIKKPAADGGLPLSLDLEETVDVLAALGSSRTGKRPVLVGFAAETQSRDDALVDLAQQKLVAKGADLIVANEVGIDRGFEEADNSAVVVSARGVVAKTGRTSKFGVANAVLDAIVARL